MSYNPTTPAKSGAPTNNASIAHTADRQGSVSGKGKTGHVNEPSPASTYGETVGGDSVPPTPLTVDEFDDPISKLNRGVENSNIAEPDAEVDDESPTESVHLSRAASRENGSKADQLGAPFGQHVGDHPRGMLLRHHNNGSSPAKLAGMVDDLNKARLSEHASSFVLQGAGNGIDDPFTSEQPNFIQTTPGRRNKFESVTPTHRAADSKVTTPSTTSLHDDVHLGPKSPFTPREDRIGQPISPENAQALNPPDACVFVANLPSNKSDAELQGAIEQAFHRYGDCWVKVRRDRRGMPFAFVQYRLKAEAEVALIRGKNLVIHGRQCRTETARAQRALYVSRKDGKMPSEEEVRQLLEKAGPIEKIFTPTETDMEKHRLPVGIWVRFAFWEDCRDASRNLRSNPIYHLEQQDEPGKMATFSPNKSFDKPVRSGSQSLQFDPNIHDARALFVGNLPGSVSRSEIEDVFRGYGPIQSVTINTRHNSGRLNSHAIVVFQSASAAASALVGERDHLALVDNTAVRVEYALLRRPGYYGSPSRYPRQSSAQSLLAATGAYTQAHASFVQQMPVAGPVYGGIPAHLYFTQHPVYQNETGFTSTAPSNTGFPLAGFGIQGPGQGFALQSQPPLLTSPAGFSGQATMPSNASNTASQQRPTDGPTTEGGVSLAGYPTMGSNWNASYGVQYPISSTNGGGHAVPRHDAMYSHGMSPSFPGTGAEVSDFNRSVRPESHPLKH